jgi:type IV pilus assembly protein PilQ
VNAQGLPNKSVTKITSNVMVKDGHTIVIGGLFREQSSSTRSQVPGLGSLPVIGGLFGKRTDSTVREEVIVLLTPHLIKDEAAYTELSEDQARNAERLRVGVRQGMMPWGRERLAEAHYSAAMKEMDSRRPNRKVALWHLNMATNLNPVFSEAINLKSRVQGIEVTSSDGSSIRDFVTDAVIRDRSVGTTQPAEEMSPSDRRGADATGTESNPSAKAGKNSTGEASADAGTPATQPAETPAQPTSTEATAPTGEATGPQAFKGGTQPKAQPAPKAQPKPTGDENATTEANVDPLEGAAPQE